MIRPYVAGTQMSESARHATAIRGRDDVVRSASAPALPRRKRVALITCGLALAAGMMAASAGAGPEVAFAQGEVDELVITITARNATGLAAFDATLIYDPETVTFVELRPGDFLPEGSELLGPEDSGDGSVSFGAFSPAGATVDGSGTLAEAVFSTLGERAPDLRLDRDNSGLSGPDGAALSRPAGLSALGVPAESIYLPWAELRR